MHYYTVPSGIVFIHTVYFVNIAMHCYTYRMAFVSKNKVSDKVAEHIFGQLSEVFLANTTKKEFSFLIDNLFTPTEKMMFAKRVAVVALLVHGYSTYKISRMLKMSSSTISKVRSQLEIGRLKHLEKIFERKKYRESFIGTLETIFSIMPARVGDDRYKHSRRRDAAWRAGGK
jgi:uncharacterized protein YerC